MQQIRWQRQYIKYINGTHMAMDHSIVYHFQLSMASKKQMNKKKKSFWFLIRILTANVPWKAKGWKSRLSCCDQRLQCTGPRMHNTHTHTLGIVALVNFIFIALLCHLPLSTRHSPLIKCFWSTLCVYLFPLQCWTWTCARNNDCVIPEIGLSVYLCYKLHIRMLSMCSSFSCAVWAI